MILRICAAIHYSNDDFRSKHKVYTHLCMRLKWANPSRRDEKCDVRRVPSYVRRMQCYTHNANYLLCSNMWMQTGEEEKKTQNKSIIAK